MSLFSNYIASIFGDAQAPHNESNEVEEEALTLEPFVFKSNQHQRYEGGHPVKGLQNCLRTIRLEKNVSGCEGYIIEPGDGYIVKIYNDDLGKPNMSDKPMRIYRQSSTSVELRGYPLKAKSPFGWMDVDYSDYGFIIYFENGHVSKCSLHMYDRDTFIDYRSVKVENFDSSSSNLCEAENLANSARQAAKAGNTSMAHVYGAKAVYSLIADPSQLGKIKDIQNVALALGKMLEGNELNDHETIKKAVGISYYLTSKAIKECSVRDPYLYVYRFSMTWEYNKVFYYLLGMGEDGHYESFGPMAQMMQGYYDHHLEGMQMADMLTEPRIGELDNALANIFAQTYSKYRGTPVEEIKRIGNGYHECIYKYLERKLGNGNVNI